MDFRLTAEQEALREDVRAFAREAVREHGAYRDAWINGYSPAVSRELGRRGWIGMGWPKEMVAGLRSPPQSSQRGAFCPFMIRSWISSRSYLFLQLKQETKMAVP